MKPQWLVLLVVNRCSVMKTKDRIIKESLLLFNESTFETTTTSLIAKKSQVLEGSLWYHFPSKKDLLVVHMEDFLTSFLAHTKYTQAAKANDIIQGLIGAYGVIWNYRYLFRDSFDKVLKKHEALAKKVADLNDHIDDWIKDTLLHSKNVGILEGSEEDVADLCEIVLMIGRHWFDYSSKRYPKKSNQYLQKRGINLLIKVIYAYLSPESKVLITKHLNNE